MVLRAAAYGLLVLALTEVSLRVLAQPSDRSAGILWGRSLPPVKLELVSPRSHPFNQQIRDFREGPEPHPARGFSQRPHFRSGGGWVRTNNIGARSNADTALKKNPRRPRVLLFGDSTTFGYSLRREESFAGILADRHPDAEWVNLAMGGYSVGQSVTAFLDVASRLEYDLAALFVVPVHDHWRDDNVVRSLNGAKSIDLLPVYELRDGVPGLVLPPSRFFEGEKSFTELGLAEFFDRLPVATQDYIREHDKFFFEPYFRNTSVFGHLFLYKAFVAARWGLRLERFRQISALYDPSGPFLPKVRAITAMAGAFSQRQGRTLALVVLPSVNELRSMRAHPEHRKYWGTMVQSYAAPGLEIIDVSEKLMGLPEDQIDMAYDERHPGPRLSEHIAQALAAHLPPRARAARKH